MHLFEVTDLKIRGRAVWGRDTTAHPQWDRGDPSPYHIYGFPDLTTNSAHLPCFPSTSSHLAPAFFKQFEH